VPRSCDSTTPSESCVHMCSILRRESPLCALVSSRTYVSPLKHYTEMQPVTQQTEDVSSSAAPIDPAVAQCNLLLYAELTTSTSHTIF
jgi:hypothetical protein